MPHRSPRRVSPTVSIVVPAFQVGPQLGLTIDRIWEVWEATDLTFEVIVADDGSVDGAPASLASRPGLTVAHLEHRGKGAALRSGTRLCAGTVVVWLDADGDIDPSFSVHAAKLVLSGADCAAGSRIAQPRAETSLRRAASAVFRRGVHVAFRLPVQDAQVGLKAFTRDVAHLVWLRCAEDGFSIDLELLAWMASRGDRVVPVPVEVRRVGTSTVTGRAAAHTAVRVAALWWQLTAAGCHSTRCLRPARWLIRHLAARS